MNNQPLYMTVTQTEIRQCDDLTITLESSPTDYTPRELRVITQSIKPNSTVTTYNVKV